MEVIARGLKTHYITKGEGKPFLILHGWTSRAERWEREIDLLSEKGLKVIVPDLPGFGETEKLSSPWTMHDYLQWFEDFIKVLNINNFYLLGYSFGGALALRIAIHYPQKVEKLFLVAPALIRQKTFFKRILARLSKLFKIFSFLPFYPYFRKAIYKFFIRKSDYPLTDNDPIMKKTYLNIIKDDNSYKLYYVKVPTVVIWAEKDEFLSSKDLDLIKNKIKNSKVITIPGADHLFYKKTPDLISEKIIENL